MAENTQRSRGRPGNYKLDQVKDDWIMGWK